MTSLEGMASGVKAPLGRVRRVGLEGVVGVGREGAAGVGHQGAAEVGCQGAAGEGAAGRASRRHWWVGERVGNGGAAPPCRGGRPLEQAERCFDDPLQGVAWRAWRRPLPHSLPLSLPHSLPHSTPP